MAEHVTVKAVFTQSVTDLADSYTLETTSGQLNDVGNDNCVLMHASDLVLVYDFLHVCVTGADLRSYSCPWV